MRYAGSRARMTRQARRNFGQVFQASLHHAHTTTRTHDDARARLRARARRERRMTRTRTMHIFLVAPARAHAHASSFRIATSAQKSSSSARRENVKKRPNRRRRHDDKTHLSAFSRRAVKAHFSVESPNGKSRFGRRCDGFVTNAARRETGRGDTKSAPLFFWRFRICGGSTKNRAARREIESAPTGKAAWYAVRAESQPLAGPGRRAESPAKAATAGDSKPCRT